MTVPPFQTAPPLIVESGKSPRTTVIFMHGLGTNGGHFEPVAEQIGRRLTQPVRFVLPHAPTRRVSLYDQTVSAWFDLLDPDFLTAVDEAGLRSAVGYVAGLVECEIGNGVHPGSIMLAGFSQGGVTALLTGLLSPHRLGGAIALSGWLPLAARLRAERSEASRGLPIFLGHGDRDPITPIDMAAAAHRHLSAWGHPVSLHVYPIGHTISPTELCEAGDWLGERPDR